MKLNKQTTWILIAMVLGVVVGYICHKMADTPEQVMSFLRDLAAKARPYARQHRGGFPAQHVVQAGTVALALAVAFVPRRRDLRQVAALGAAVLIGQRLFDAVLRAMRRRGVGHGGWVTMMVVFALSLGAVTQWPT